MNIPHKGSCKGCKHAWTDPTSQLFCRFMPPTCFLMPGPQGQPIPVSTFAPVQPDQTCGQYKPKISLEN